MAPYTGYDGVVRTDNATATAAGRLCKPGTTSAGRLSHHSHPGLSHHGHPGLETAACGVDHPQGPGDRHRPGLTGPTAQVTDVDVHRGIDI